MIRILGCILGARGDDARGDDARGHDAQYRCGSGVHPQDALEDAHPKHRAPRSRRSGPARDSARAAWTVTRPGPAARSLGLGRDLADSDSEKSEIR